MATPRIILFDNQPLPTIPIREDISDGLPFGKKNVRADWRPRWSRANAKRDAHIQGNGVQQRYRQFKLTNNHKDFQWTTYKEKQNESSQRDTGYGGYEPAEDTKRTFPPLSAYNSWFETDLFSANYRVSALFTEPVISGLFQAAFTIRDSRQR